MKQMLSNESIAFAAKPMRLLQQLEVACGYERSFKFTRNSIQANRFVLGVNTSNLSSAQWQYVATELGLPPEFKQPFFEALPRSSTVLIGFDLGADQKPVYKLYLEFLSDMPTRASAGGITTPFLLGIGYKWQADRPSRQLITRYDCHPFLTCGQIAKRIGTCIEQMENTGLQPVTEIILQAASAAGRKRFLYLEVTEAGSRRASFDINLYPSELKVGDVVKPLDRLARSFSVPEDEYRRLLPLVAGSLLGHISAGTNSGGSPYFSLYYEAD